MMMMTKERACQILKDAKTNPPRTPEARALVNQALALLANGWGPPASG